MFHPSESLPSNHLPLYTLEILKSLIHSPPLITEIHNTYQLDPTTLNLPANPPTLNVNQKLGHLYEDALTLLLKHSTRYQLIANNLQIQDGKTTIGELDYIIRDTHTNHIHHLELAIKFYLTHTTENGETSYPGPDARDNFHRKLNRLTNHQLNLTTHPATQAILKQKYNITHILPTHLIHGIIHQKINRTQLPNEASENATTRPHIPLQELPTNTQNIKIIPKPLWLCPPEHHWLQTLPTTSQTDLQNIANNRVTLIHSNQHPTPTFITPPTWPNLKNT